MSITAKACTSSQYRAVYCKLNKTLLQIGVAITATNQVSLHFCKFGKFYRKFGQIFYKSGQVLKDGTQL